MSEVFIPNKEGLERKVTSFMIGGPGSMHVLSDFDRTLTKAYFRGEKTPSLISHLRNGNYLSSDYAVKAHALFDKYHPIEENSGLSKEYRNKMMMEWWTSHYKLLVESGLDEAAMKKATSDLVKEGRIALRDGAKEFIETLHAKNIPLIIMSAAGIGNMVTEFLRLQGLDYPNVHFIGNTLQFDKKGKFTGIEDDRVIHTFNKHEIEVRGLPAYQEIAQRKNVLLLGDSMGDIGMIEGFPYQNLIRVGFFNGSEEGNLKEFNKNFDMILMNDSGFDPVNNLLKRAL